MFRVNPRLLAATIAAIALPALAGCATCRDGDIGSKNCLAKGGGLGSGYKAPLAVVENAAWVPYRMATTPLTGLVQGGVGWYEVCGEPVSATLTLPVGAVIGSVVGTVNAFGQNPVMIERDDNFFHALNAPFITDQEVWKYSTPPHGRPLYAAHAPIPQLMGDGETSMRVAPYGYAESFNFVRMNDSSEE